MTTSSFDPALSVLDLVPVHSGQTSTQAITASLRLAEVADRAGFRRYWFAEHHNMQAVASTSPAVLIALAAARTRRIRLGSGGVMLPNHAPLIVAEQFAALEAAAPGRIDLGIGRAPGSDPVVNALLRSSGVTSSVEAFPNHVADVMKLLLPEGTLLRLASDRDYTVRATPAASAAPQIWLLGSSDYSARLAARLGLPYVFANHFSGQGIERALDLYRTGFTPAEGRPEPHTFVTVNAVVAESSAEAERLALPHLVHMSRLVTGGALGPQLTVEEAADAKISDAQQHIVNAARRRWIIGTPQDAKDRIRELARQNEVDEVMIVPVAGWHEGNPADRATAREETLTLLARGR